VEPFKQLGYEASLMMTHSIRHGLQLPAADIDTIVQTNHLLSEGKTLDADTESRFLGAYERTARLIRPASIESLSAIVGEGGTRLSGTPADRAVRWYTILAFATFFVLAVMQVFWTIGSGLVTDLTDAKAQFDAASVQFAPYLPGTRALGPGQVPHPLGPEEQTKEETLSQQVQSALEVMRGYDSALIAWNNLASTPLQLFHWGRALSTDSGSGKRPIEFAFFISPDEQQQIATNTATARFALQAIQMFVLPLMYGLLGASIYILRRLSTEIRLLTYQPINDYRLRIPTGALAGVAIGWMFNPDAVAPLKSLPPLALAFLAGYSVEVLFSALDRLASSFSQDSEKKPEKSSG
jgi:hypothetical protein